MGAIDEVSATLGEHGAKLDDLGQKVDRLVLSVDTLITERHQREGSRKTVMGAATLLGGIAGALASFFHK